MLSRDTPSITFLVEKIEDLFAGNRLPKPVFAHFRRKIAWPSRGIIDVILIDNGLHTLLNCEKWPEKAGFRLWVLARPYAQALMGALGLSEGAIRSLPRYGLFPFQEELRAFPRPDEPFDLVFSGRPGRDKQFGLTLEVARSLQIAQGIQGTQGKRKELRFLICTPAIQLGGERYHAASGPGWPTPARWLGDLGRSWYEGFDFRDPVLIQLSIHSKEDFGVSIAQAQQQGWPLIVSDWGGHRDLRGTNIIRVDPLDIANKRIDEIVDQIRSGMGRLRRLKSVAPPVVRTPLLMPRVFTRKELISLIERFHARSTNGFEHKLFWFHVMSGRARGRGKAGTGTRR